MSRCVTCLMALSLCIMGCQHENNSTAAVEQQMKMNKPIVALVPIIDHSHSDLTWRVSDELTRSIQEQLIKHNHLYLVGDEKIQAITKKLTDDHDPFGPHTQWIKKAFRDQEFVVFMELIEHDEIPVHASKEGAAQDSPAELTMSMRLRVFDLRGEEPKIVLQELLHNSQHIPRQFTKANFYQVPWGNETFDISPLGMAHAQLTQELANRIEDYILISEKK